GESSGVPSRFVACSAAGHIALILAFEGRHQAALHWAQRAEDGSADEPWIRRITHAPVQLAAAYAALDASDSDRAAEVLEQVGPLSGILEVWPLLLDAHARLALVRGTPVATLDAIEHAA